MIKILGFVPKFTLAMLVFTFFSFQGFASAETKFESWKKNYIKRASKRGLPKYFTRKHLRNVKFDKDILKKDKKQITSNRKIDYEVWIKKWRRKGNLRIQIAKEMLVKHKNILQRIERKYNVDKEIIVSLWGVETFFGTIVGDYDLISSLSSLAYKSRRKRFFEIQLSAAFRLLYKGHVKRSDLKGSWAGATGQLQFMPSNFNGYAKDFDGDKIKDIWNNHGDIFASIAYFLKKRGWTRNGDIGKFVKNRSPSSKDNSLIQIPFNNSPQIKKGPNYKTIMNWNNSSLFAALNMIMLENLKKN